MVVNIHEAKTHFSRLVERACGGEEIVIARSGVPLLRLARLEGTPKNRTPGLSKGSIAISADFGAPLDESILREFEK
jgi:antitoxin (DNA-binding transcriptional repressor) of toxin-antitoxin stability system